MVEAVCSLGRNAGLQAVANLKKERVKFDKDEGYSLIRPADVSLSSEQCVGMTVSMSTSDTYKAHAVVKDVNIRAEEKVKKSEATCKAYGLEITPIVLDCCGIIYSDAWRLLQRFADSNQTSTPYSKCIAICRCKISFALHLGLAHQLVPLLLYHRVVGSCRHTIL